jgi:hypothetical protein
LPYLLVAVTVFDGIVSDGLKIVLKVCVCVWIAVGEIAHVIHMRKFLRKKNSGSCRIVQSILTIFIQ